MTDLITETRTKQFTDTGQGDRDTEQTSKNKGFIASKSQTQCHKVTS